jgi:hypothetical protein
MASLAWPLCSIQARSDESGARSEESSKILFFKENTYANLAPAILESGYLVKNPLYTLSGGQEIRNP